MDRQQPNKPPQPTNNNNPPQNRPPQPVQGPPPPANNNNNNPPQPIQGPPPPINNNNPPPPVQGPPPPNNNPPHNRQPPPVHGQPPPANNNPPPHRPPQPIQGPPPPVNNNPPPHRQPIPAGPQSNRQPPQGPYQGQQQRPMPPQVHPSRQAAVLTPPQYSPPEFQEQRRAALMEGLNAAEKQNPSALVASVIAHREQTVRQQTTGLKEETQSKGKGSESEEDEAAGRPRRTSILERLRGTTPTIFRKRVPVLLQMSEVECGAASLAMILRYYGRKTSISEVSERAGIGRDGLSALGIVKAARGYGMRVRAISLKENDFRYVNLPAIIHWQFNHFMIVEHWSPTRVDVVDPAHGRKHYSAEEFDAGFTGVVLMLEPGIQFVKHTAAPQVTLGTYVAQYLRRAPAVLVQIIGASILLQLFGLAVPILTKIVVNEVIPFKLKDILPLLGAGLLVILTAQLVTMLLRGALLVYLQTRIDTYIMPSFFEHMLTLPPGFFQKRSSGDIMARLSSNSVVRDIISNQLVSAFLDGSFVIFYLIILLTQSPTFGILVIIIGFVQVILLLSTNGSMRALTRRQLESAGKTQGYVAEVLAGIDTLKAAGAEHRALGRWTNLFFDQLNTTINQNYLSSIIGTFMSTLRSLSPLLLLWVGTIQVINGNLDVGTMLALNALASAFLTPVASLVNSAQQLQVVNSHLERIADVLDAQPEQDIQRVQQPPRLSGRIRLEHVNFRYDGGSPLVLKDITLSIEPGQKIAIVGRTGSGKSTLGRLALGLCLPTEGEIYYDNIPLRFLNYQAVRAQFGVVMQNAAVFSGSIRENIAFNVPDMGIERIVKAAQMAAIHDDIMLMPMGYETFVSEGGTVLSGGQRQRLAIARALAHSPAIMLLDEATSALDVITERIVEENFNSLGCTQIIIAHRLSTVRNADRILVIDEGKLVEHGSHHELVKLNKYYARLIQSQLSSGEIKND